MYTHNLDPVLLNFGFLEIRWYSLAYIFGILFGWWLGKKIISHILKHSNHKFNPRDFDDLITYIVISIIIGGRIGYVIFYNLAYYISNPFDIIKVWEGGMSFHGALIGIIVGTYLFLICYGVFRIISEFFREPDIQVGYFFNILSMGMILSILMIVSGLLIMGIMQKK